MTVKGLNEEKTVSTNVEAQKATTLEVATDKLLDETEKSKIGVTLKDQYGTELTITPADYTVTAYNTTQNKSVTVATDATDKFVVDTRTVAGPPVVDNFKAGDKVTVTFIHKATGLKVTQELEVVAGAQLASVELGDVELPTGKTVLTEDLTNVKVSYVAKDQYGNATTLTKGGNVEIISSDDAILNPSDVRPITEDKVNKLNIDKFGSKTGSVTLTVINKVTGDTAKVTLDVQQKAGAISGVAFEKTALDVAQSSGSQTVDVDLVVTDNYGNKIEAKEYAPGAANAFTVSTSNNNVATAAIVTGAGADQGKLKVTVPNTAKKGDKATITVTANKTGETATLNVTIGEAATASEIVVAKDSKHSTSLAAGASTTVKFAVNDQYGNNVPRGYTAEYSTKNNDGVVTIDDAAKPSIKVTANKAGSAIVVATLKNGAGDVVSTKEVTFNVVANSSENLTYSLAELPTLFKVGASSNGFQSANIDKAGTHEGDYAKELKIVAKDASGNTFNVNPESIVSVSSSNENVGAYKDAATGKWYVYGDNRGKDPLTEDVTAKLTVVYNAEDGVKNLTSDVTVSKADRQAKEIKFVDKALNAADADKAKDVVSFTSSTNVTVNLLNGKDAFIWVEDQFGGFTLGEATSDYGTGQNVEFTVVGSNGAHNLSDNTVKVTGSQFAVKLSAIADVSNDDAIANGSTVRIIATAKNGVAKSLDIKVSSTADEAAPTAPANTDFVITDAADNNGKISTKESKTTFSESVKVEYKAVAEGAEAPAATVAADGSTNKFAKVYETSTDLFTGLNITKAANDVYVRLVDASGNKSAWVKISEAK